MRASLRRAVAGIALIVFVWAPLARASGAAEASATYKEGLGAYGRGDFATAARAFARADELAPNAVALAAALDACVMADEPVLAAELLERAESRPPREPLVSMAQRARAELGGKVGRIRVVCSSCDAVAVDGARAARDVVVVRAGTHVVAAASGRDRRLLSVEVTGGAVVEVTPFERAAVSPAPATSPAPAVSSAPAAPSGAGRPSPAWFYASLGATVLAAGAATLSAVDVGRLHDQFVDNGCERPTPASERRCTVLSLEGERAELRTLALVGTAGLFAATTVVSAFVVRLGGTSVRAAANGTSAALHLSGSF